MKTLFGDTERLNPVDDSWVKAGCEREKNEVGRSRSVSAWKVSDHDLVKRRKVPRFGTGNSRIWLILPGSANMGLRLLLAALVILCLTTTPTLAQDIPRPLTSISFQPDSILGVSADAAHVAVWERGGQLRIYDLAHYYEPIVVLQLKDILDSYSGLREDIVWSGDHTKILLLLESTLHLITVSSGAMQQVGNKLDSRVYSSARFFEDNRYIVAQTGEYTPSQLVNFETFVWDTTSLKQVLHLASADLDCPPEVAAHTMAGKVIRFMRQGGFYLCSGTDWNADQSQYMTWLFWNSGPAETIKVYDTASHNLRFELSHYRADSTRDNPRLADLETVSWSPDGSKIVSVPQSNKDMIRVWDAKTGNLLVSVTPTINSDDESSAPSFTPVFSEDGKQLITGGTPGYAFIWDLASGKLIHRWHHSDSLLRGARWVLDNRLVAVWGWADNYSDKGVTIWDASTGQLRWLMVANGDPENIVENKSLGQLMVVSASQIDLYDLASLAEH